MSRPSARRGLSEREAAALRAGQAVLSLPEPVREVVFMVGEFMLEEMQPECGRCAGTFGSGEPVNVCLHSDPDRRVLTVQLQHYACAEAERTERGYQERVALAN